MDNIEILCADIGGSHIAAAMVDLKTQTSVPKTLVRRNVNSNGSAEEIISAWCTVLAEVISQQSLTAHGLRIALAMPGPFDYEGGISYIKGLQKYESIYGLNVKDLIAKHLGIQPSLIRLKNDAASFLHGEVITGAAQGFEHVIGFTLGTGIGTARFHNGISEDADLWKLPYKDTFSEEYLATRWFLRRYKELTGKSVKDVKELTLLVDSYPIIDRIFAEFSEHLAEFLSKFVKMDNPEVIVMGGNISKASMFFLPKLTEILATRGINVPIRIAMLGEDAAMLGAANCWVEERINHL